MAISVLLLIAGGIIWKPAQPQTVRSQPPPPAVASVSVLSPAVDCEIEKCIALTFDDGPRRTLTPQILDTLKRHNARATFFVLGRFVGGNEDMLQRMHREGHEIGNHTWNHPDLTKIPLDQVQAEIQSTQDAVMRAGVPPPELFRPPYGATNEAVLAHIPLTVVRWNIDPEDWNSQKRAHMLEHMAAQARPGSVVVMHDTEQITADKLEELILQLSAKNYKLVPVSEALGINPGQRGVYFNR